MELTVARIVLLCAFVFCHVVQSLHFTHMLQLNSYRPERFWQWCKENENRLVGVRTLLPALLLPLMYLPPLWCLIASSAVLLVTALLNLPKKAKKPLVFTARVKRLLTTQYALIVLIAVLCFFLSEQRCVGIVAVCSLQVWVWTFASNFLNTPIEKVIANGYVRDAKRRLNEHRNLTVIGVTGSYGKTSTKTCLQALLSTRYNVLMTPESYNTTMGVVRTIRERLRPSHEIFIAEMGAKNKGDIQEICDLVQPQYGVITSIGEQHLETFKTLDTIVATKFELADALPENGRLFANADNDYIRDRLATLPPVCPVTTYGVGTGDFTVTDMHVTLTGTVFTVKFEEQEQTFTTHLLGAHMVQNLVGCIAVAVSLGIPLAELTYPVRRLKPIEHRLQLLPNGFIDDAYNSNPAGFRSALDVLSGFDAERVLVTPGMVELGERQEPLNRELGAYAAARCDIAILVGEKQAPPLKEGLLSENFPEQNIYVVKTLQEGLATLRSIPCEGNRIVLLENDLPDNF